MPNYTEKLNLEKPLQTEFYNVDVQNQNMEKIDKFAKEMGVETADLKRYIDDNSGKTPLGFIQDTGTKTVGNLYRDKITNGLFYCKANTSINYNSADYFEDYSNYANGNKLKNLDFETGIFENIKGYTNCFLKYTRIGNIVAISGYVNASNNNGIDGEIFKLPKTARFTLTHTNFKINIEDFEDVKIRYNSMMVYPGVVSLGQRITGGGIIIHGICVL